MLGAWLAAESLHDHEIIGFAIADPEGGVIATKAGIYQPRGMDEMVQRNPRMAPLRDALVALSQ